MVATEPAFDLGRSVRGAGGEEGSRYRGRARRGDRVCRGKSGREVGGGWIVQRCSVGVGGQRAFSP